MDSSTSLIAELPDEADVRLTYDSPSAWKLEPLSDDGMQWFVADSIRDGEPGQQMRIIAQSEIPALLKTLVLNGLTVDAPDGLPVQLQTPAPKQPQLEPAVEPVSIAAPIPVRAQETDWAVILGGALGIGIIAAPVAAVVYWLQPDDPKPLTPVQIMQQRDEAAWEDVARCNEGSRELRRIEGEIAKAEADIAIAGTAKTADADQARELRRMVEIDLQLFPGTGNGWREVLINKGEYGKRTIERLQPALVRARTDSDEACAASRQAAAKLEKDLNK